MKKELEKKIENRVIKVGVVGLGYVGLPLAVEKAKAGFKTIGFDVQKAKVDLVNEGHNYIGDVVDTDLEKLVKDGMLSATTDFSFVKDVDFIAICVPTPLDEHQQPDISYVKNSTIEIAKYMTKGTMVVLESTTYPGAFLEILHGRIMNGFARCQLGGVYQITQGRGHILDGIDDHDLRVRLRGAQRAGTLFDGFRQLHWKVSKTIFNVSI